MEKIAVLTDTNSSITTKEAAERGIYLTKMPFTIDGEEYVEDVNCTYEEFCERLEAGADVSGTGRFAGSVGRASRNLR